ncbi:MAG: hypothetical protein LC635_01680, partial [Pseudonocardiaceae bacterium]|nr:hypothetical protein [Pseudonocardiaceae bacterium]
MSRWLSAHLPPAAGRPLSAAGSVLLLVAAMLPWATFVFSDGAYPDKATLQFFDAPFALTGYRWHVFLFGLVALVVMFAPVPAKGRVLRALGWGSLTISAITAVFITSEGGGLGAITAADGVTAFGSVVGIIGGLLLVLGAEGIGIGPIPEWPASPFGLTDWPQRLFAWAVLLVVFAAVLWLVSETLTAGGQSGISSP